jgi:hypothetical protein
VTLAHALAIAIATRYSNVRVPTRDDVDFTSWRLRFKQTKNGEPHDVPWSGRHTPSA